LEVDRNKSGENFDISGVEASTKKRGSSGNLRSAAVCLNPL